MAEIFYFHVQEDRSIKYKLLEPIMQEDKDVATWRFRIPKVLNQIDMSAWSWWFVYVNAKGQEFSELLTLTDDIDDPSNYSTADYDIDYGISKFPGFFSFALEAISAQQGGEIDGEWHTKTYKHKVDSTLQGNQAQFAETESDIISALIQQIQQKYNTLVGGATPLPVNLKSLMTDHDKVYLYTGSEDGEQTGYWYYWNGTNFVPGRLYGAGVQIDPTLSQSGQAADAAVVGEELANLKNAITNVIANTGFTVGGVKAITPATQNMFEKTIFSEDVGHAPQGFAVYGNIAYVSNGATYPLNVINEIDLTSGTFTTHTVSGLTYGANSLAIDSVNGLLYAAEHNNGGKVFAIDISTWQIVETKTLPSEISSLANNGWNIVYDSSDQSFYNYSNKEYKIYKLNADFEIIETINIVADDKFPTEKPGVTQGFGYDGTYFYIPRSEVYDVYGNSFMFVVDKSGKIIKYVRGCHDEIEEYAYDFSTGKSYACYALSASGYITEFVTDSGWIAINDYLSDSYQSKTTPAKIDFENTDAKFRIRDGVIYFNGKIKAINNNGTLCYLDGRIAPMNDIYTVVPVTETATYASQHDTAKLNLSATTYWSPDFTYKYVPVLNKPTINGYWWLDGVSAPLGRY
jgi:hypothetical protein